MASSWFGRCLVWVLLFASMIRIGEASNPGPGMESFVIGATNPSGIVGKSMSYLDLEPGIWSISETQATEVGFKRFVKELRMFQPKDRNLQVRHGAFAPPRLHSRTAGSWTGVAQMSDFPMRVLEIPWRGHEWSSGRTMVSSFHLGQHCLVGATVYGPPKGPTYANHRSLTAELLSTITEEIVYGLSGPRFVAGDLNLDTCDLPVFDLWRQAGWCEIQEFAESRWNCPRVPTCKGTTIRDHVWLSPEMLGWITQVNCQSDVFADRAALSVSVQVPLAPCWLYSWPSPPLIPWHLLDTSRIGSSDQSSFHWNFSDLTVDFQKWSQKAETELLQQVALQTPLPNAAAGRGQVVDVVRKPATHVPLKAGRHGDVRPRSHLLNRTMHLWFKQVRRLQAFVQRASLADPSPAVQHDQMATWRAILRAPGFRPSFSVWWAQREIQHHGVSTWFPVLPPPYDVALALFHDMEANYRHLERWHVQQRHAIIQAKHADHNKLLFHQLKDTGTATLTHFRHTLDFVVAVLHPGTWVELDLPVPDLSGHITWTLEGSPVKVTCSVGSCMVSVDSDLLPVVGHRLRVTTFVTDFQQLEADLHTLWDPIWNRHAGLAESHWDRVVSFGLAHLPSRDCPPVDWTSDTVATACANYKRKVTRGPDAWHRQDLLALSDLRLGDLAGLFQAIETGAPWPRQLVTGFVCPIPKTSLADQPALFRPIVLISFLYRAWSSASSKHFLPLLVAAMSPHVFGYLQGRRATDVWSLLQLCVESAFAFEQPLCGYNADLTKCFNRLPRHPLLRLIRHLGFSSATTLAWTNALDGLQRRFRIRSSTGPARSSCTGFPEGDPLSCTAMLLFNLLFDLYVKFFAPECIPLAFVDNLQLLSSSAPLLQHGVLVMRTFMEAWDQSLDSLKSFAWATCSDARAALRHFGHVVRLAHADLGAQMVYSKLVRKHVFQKRMDATQHYWKLLRHSTAHAWFKKLAIRMAAWPKLLHSVENAWVPEALMDKLRSRCLFALGWDRAGANPVIRWSWMQPLGYDPDFFQLWQVLSNFGRLVRTFPWVRSAWAASRFADFQSAQGILHAMEQALEQLQWTLDADLVLYVREMRFDWLTLNWETLRKLAAHCWQQSLCTKVSHRKDFVGLTSINVEVSFRSFKVPTVADSELVATIQDGTFFTGSYLSKFDVGQQALCSLCGCADTLGHRCCACPRYAAIRARHLEQVACWDQHPRFFNEHGLVLLNPFLWQHWVNLIRQQVTVERFYAAPGGPGTQHLFTDGSCLHSNCEIKRLGAWAVVCMDTNVVISHGLVAGLTQSVDAAELTAAHSALLWSLHFRCSVVLHTDSQYVFAGLEHLRTFGSVPAKWKNGELWRAVLSTMRQLDHGQWQVHKVFSHYDETLADDPVQMWFIRGNAKADFAAQRAHECLAGPAGEVYAQLCAHHDADVLRVRKQLHFLLDIAHFDLERSAHAEPVDVEDLPTSVLTQQRVPNESSLLMQFEFDTSSNLAFNCSSGFSLFFRQQVLSLVLDLDTVAAHAKFVSNIELLAAFLVLEKGSIPHARVVGNATIYEDPGKVTAGGLVRHTIANAMGILRKCIVFLLEQHEISFSTGRSNRPDLGVFMPTWAVFMGWPDEIEVLVRPLIQSWFVTRPCRRVCDLARPLC